MGDQGNSKCYQAIYGIGGVLKEVEMLDVEKVLELDLGNGLKGLILKVGGWYTAYVGVPKGSGLAGILEKYSLDELPIEVHGGITFFGCGMEGDPRGEGYLWIGWDYAHAGDMIATPVGVIPGKVWTLEEIKEHIEDVAKQLNRLQERG